MTIKWRLAAVMADRELDYKDLAARTGLHPGTVSRLKNLKVMPSRLDRDTLEVLCRALGCQPGELLRFTDDQPDIVKDLPPLNSSRSEISV